MTTTIQSANLHQEGVEVTVWGHMKKMHMEIYAVVAFQVEETEFYATSTYDYSNRKWIDPQFYSDSNRKIATATFDKEKDATWMQIEFLIYDELSESLQTLLDELQEDIDGIMTLEQLLKKDEDEEKKTAELVDKQIRNAVASQDKPKLLH